MDTNLEQNIHFIPSNVLKMALSCSRCKNLVTLTCTEGENTETVVDCNYYHYKGKYEEIALLVRGCPKYDEDFEILRQTLHGCT